MSWSWSFWTGRDHESQTLAPIGCDGGSRQHSRVLGVGSLGYGTLAAGSTILVDEEENNADAEENNEDPVSKRQKVDEDNSSPVWKFAEIIEESSGSKQGSAKCNLCKKVFHFPTTNVMNHILSKHRNTPEGKELNEDLEKGRSKREETLKLKQQKHNTPITNYFSPHSITNAERSRIDEAVVEYFMARNVSFYTAEDHFFRKMLHKCHSGYTALSQFELQRKVDAKIEVIKGCLSKEIQDDVKTHKSIALTSDGGTSSDQNKTKKKPLTCSRITENWELKTDTIAVPKAVGSQTGPVIRAQWKQELCKIGYTSDWRVLITTDAAPNEVSARAPGRHDDVGLIVGYATDCADHQVSQLFSSLPLILNPF